MIRVPSALSISSSRARAPIGVLLVVLLAVVLRVFEQNPAVAQTPAVTSWHVPTDPGIDPSADVWRQVPAAEVPLSGQNITYPQGGLDVGGPGTTTVAVRSVHTDDALFVSVRWRDQTRSDASHATEDFADAVAVQWPADPRVSVPAVCMGQADNAVNIWQWRADSQAGPAVEPLAPHGYVDHYPATDDMFHPARAAGNPFASVDAAAVQNLVAGGFGTLTPVTEQTVEGRGTHEDGVWTTVFRRSFESPGEFQPAFRRALSTDVAFAVWDGSRGDRDGMKSVTSFVQLRISDEPAPTVSGLLPFIGWTVLVIAIVALALIIAAPVRPEDGTPHVADDREDHA